MFTLTAGACFLFSLWNNNFQSLLTPDVTGLTFSMKSTLLFPLSFMFLLSFYTVFPPYYNSELWYFSVQPFSHWPGLSLTMHEWKLKYKLITAPQNRGRPLTLSHREPGIINSPGIVRGICMAIFTRHNYYQSGEAVTRGRTEWVSATVSEQHLSPRGSLFVPQRF